MKHHAAVSLALCVLLLAACRKEAPVPAAGEPAQPEPTAAAPATPAETPAPASAAAPAGTEFDPASVPESSADLPPFPFFKAPDGLESLLSDKERNVGFDREHMIVGDKVAALEGKVFRDRFFLANETRPYTEIEFQRNYRNAIDALGGREVSSAQHTNEANDAFGGREAVDAHYHGVCASDGCQNHTYLIRKAGKEYWIQVSTGAIPLHGHLVVLEKEGMKQSLGFLDAAAMKKSLDASGRVALQVNFDTDKATLRPDAAPVIAEIATLLQDDPSLKLSVDGHTDSTGGAEHNRTLSGARAAAVVAALVAKGIDGSRLASQGYGPDKPVADNATDAGRAQNRRVELVKR